MPDHGARGPKVVAAEDPEDELEPAEESDEDDDESSSGGSGRDAAPDDGTDAEEIADGDPRADRAAARPRRPAEPAFVADLPRGKDRPTPAVEPATAPPPRRGNAPARAARPPDPRLADELGDDGAGPDQEGPIVISQRDRPNRPPIQPRGRRPANDRGRSPLKPVTIGVAVVIAGFLVLAGVLSRRSELAFEVLGSMPLLGRLLGDDHLLLWRLQITGVETGLDRIKGDRAALVVSGQVVNTTSQTLRLIEVEGLLLADGVERRRQVVYAANQFRKTIRDLSASEVEMLLRLEPNRRFAVKPGESASFLIVFPDPPSNATEVTCRVVDARPA
jgi:hypothetical protein